MPRTGYTTALAALLEAQPSVARPIVEILDIVSGDIKTSEADFKGEDGVLAGLELLVGGGIQLTPTGGDVIGIGDEIATGQPGVTLDNAPRQDGLVMLVLQCSSAIAQKPINRVKMRMDNSTAGNAATDAFCRVYRLDRVISISDDDEWQLQSLTVSIPATNKPTAGATNEEIIFDLPGSGGILPGAAPTESTSGALTAFGLASQSTYVVICWAIRSNGTPAPLALWRTWDFGGFQIPPVGDVNSTVSGREFPVYLTVGDNYEPDILARASAMPIALLAGATFVFADAIWIVNPIDLGVVPIAGTALQIQITSTTGSDSAVLTFIRELGSGTWRACIDGDLIGVDNLESGNDLSAIPRVQKYEIRADLVPSTDTVISPKLLRFGVLEVTSTLVDDEIEVESFEQAFDPFSSQSEVPTASVVFRRDGVRDYRSFGEDLVSTNPFTALIARFWIGHPTRLPKSEWLFIDDYIIRNLDTAGDGVRLDLASSLLLTLDDFPVQGSRSVDFDFTSTLAVAWDDFHDSINVPDRLIGTGPTTTESTKDVDKTILAGDTEIGIDLRREIDFLSGGVTISSQGQWVFVPLFDSLNTNIEIAIDDYEVIGFDYGMDRRISEVSIQYPDVLNPGEYLEQTYSAPAEILAALGTIGGAVRTVFGSPINLWFPFSANAKDLPDLIGPRLVNYFGTGVTQLRIRSRTPRPQLQLGDALSVQSDLYLFNNPFTGAPVRGLTWYRATVAGQHDILGRDLTLWLEPPFLSL